MGTGEQLEIPSDGCSAERIDVQRIPTVKGKHSTEKMLLRGRRRLSDRLAFRLTREAGVGGQAHVLRLVVSGTSVFRFL